LQLKPQARLSVALATCVIALCGCGTARQATEAPAADTAIVTGLHSTIRAARRLIATTAAKGSRRRLSGVTVGVDPGHNGRNYTDTSFINHLIWNGREQETCNTTGTETDSGYTEAQFNFNVATLLAGDLRKEGARVVMTRHNNDGVGPCVNRRAQIINASGAKVAVDIHADGGPASGRGFAVLLPVPDGTNDRVVKPSRTFGLIVRDAFRSVTGMPVSTYDGVDGLRPRDDLAGLNLSTVPVVLIETGNMRNATDAALLVTKSFQRLAARALAGAITKFIRARTRH
jgi:N-acetylmuramoyl-L-alanine amidase